MEKEERLAEYTQNIVESTRNIKSLFRIDDYDSIIKQLEILDTKSVDIDEIIEDIDHDSDEYKSYIEAKNNFNEVIKKNIGKNYLDDEDYNDFINKIRERQKEDGKEDFLPTKDKTEKPHSYFRHIIDAFKASRKIRELMGMTPAIHFRSEPYKEDLIERLRPLAFGISDKTYDEIMEEHAEYVRRQIEKDKQRKEELDSMFKKDPEQENNEQSIGSK